MSGAWSVGMTFGLSPAMPRRPFRAPPRFEVQLCQRHRRRTGGHPFARGTRWHDRRRLCHRDGVGRRSYRCGRSGRAEPRLDHRQLRHRAGVKRRSYPTRHGLGGRSGRTKPGLDRCQLRHRAGHETERIGRRSGRDYSGSTTASYWDTSTAGATWSAGGTAATTAQLQAPTGYSGLYADWNVDLNDDGTVDDPWNFGATGQYPALKTNSDGQGTATWQEFGHQLRAGPTLTVTADGRPIALSWTAVDASAWSPAPDMTYTVTRQHGTTVTVKPVAGGGGQSVGAGPGRGGRCAAGGRVRCTTARWRCRA